MDNFLLVLFNQTLAHPLLDVIMLVITLAVMGVFPALGVGFIVAGRRRLGVAILLALGVSLVWVLAFQYLVWRPRPVEVRLVWPQPNFPSYPSGHAAATFAVALVLGLTFKKPWVWIAALGAAALTALSRVYLGFHYPSDVLGGSILGAGVGAAIYGVMLEAGPGKSVWRWLVWPQIALVLLATQIAYLGILPLRLLRWPFSDKVLHFLLFGAVVFWLNFWLNGRSMRLGNWSVALAFIVPFSVALVEELLQSLSPLRTTDWTDLACDLAGMLLFLWLSRCILARVHLKPALI